MVHERFRQIGFCGELNELQNSADWKQAYSAMIACFSELDCVATHFAAESEESFRTGRILQLRRNTRRIDNALKSGENFSCLELFEFRNGTPPHSLYPDACLAIGLHNDFTNEWRVSGAVRISNEQAEIRRVATSLKKLGEALAVSNAVVLEAEWQVSMIWWFADISCGAGPKLNLLSYTGKPESFYSRNVQRLLSRQSTGGSCDSAFRE